MEINNVFSPVPFYKNKKYWHSNKWYTYGQKCPIMMTSQNTLPFQLVVNSGVTLSSFTIKKADNDTVVRTVSTSGSYFNIAGESYNVIQVKACTISALPYGNYYYALTLSDGSTYISDIIAIISDMSKCIKITYKNVENLYFSSGHIDFSNDFVFELYLPTTIGKPAYEYEEELTKRLGYKFLESQVVNKVYKFTFPATEQMCDAYRFVRMCDYIRIDTYNPDFSEYDHYNVIYLSSEVDWLDNGDIASIETSFETDSIVQKLQDYSRTQLVNFYNALLSNSDEVLKFDDEAIAQYYNNYLQSIDGKMIRQLDEASSISDNTVIAIDENNGAGAANKILLKPLLVNTVAEQLQASEVLANFQQHINDSSIHITAAERAVLSLFGVDDNGDVYVKGDKGFYTNSFVSAKGKSSSTGGGSGASALYQLVDVLANENNDGVQGATTNSVLMYNGTKWYAGTIGTGLDEAALKAYLDANKYTTTVYVDSQVSTINNQITTINSQISVINSQLDAKADKTDLDKKVDSAFFARVFGLLDANDNEIAINDVTTVADSIKAKFGLWTEQYISAKGKNSSGDSTGSASALYQLVDVLANENNDGVQGATTNSVLMYNGTKWYAGIVNTGLDEAALKSYLDTNKYTTTIYVDNQLDTKADKTALSAYLPLTGGTITGDLTVNGTIYVGATNYVYHTGNLAGDNAWITLASNVISHKTIHANNITLIASSGQFVTGYTVDKAGHVTSISQRALNASDIPSLAITQVTGLQDALDKKVDSAFFARVFGLLDANGNEIAVNDVTTVADSIKAKFGLWTEQYLSAKGKNPSSGGSTGSASALYQLADVMPNSTNDGVLNAANGSVLMYNGSKWQAGNAVTDISPLTLNVNGSSLFTYDGKSSITANLTVPTKVSQLTNDTGFITGISSSMVTNALGYTPYNSANPNGYISGITKAMVEGVLTGNITSHTHSYLPLSGGTLTGDLSLNQYLRINAWSGYGSGSANIWYDGTIKQLKCGSVDDISLQNGELVFHSRNYFNYALPLSGGTMTGNITMSGMDTHLNWNVDYLSGGWSRNFIVYNQHNSSSGALVNVFHLGGYGSSNGFEYAYIGTVNYDGDNLRFNKSGTITIGTHKILHANNYNSYAPTLTGTGASGTWGISITGKAVTSDYSYYLRGRATNGTYFDSNAGNNIIAEWNTKSDYRWYLKAASTYECRVDYATSAGNADTLDGYHKDDILHKTYDPTSVISLNNTVAYGLSFTSWSYSGSVNINDQPWGNGVASAASVVTFGTAYPFQIYSDYNDTSLLYFRSFYSNTGWKAWRQFAFLDSNVASATKLQTARTLWGQSFDGTSNVSGNIIGVGSISPAKNNSYNIGSAASQFRWIYANGVYAKSGSFLSFGANNADHIMILTNGNVGIGTTSPSVKLHVIGDIAATGAVTAKASSSDIRLKTDITDYKALSIIRSHKSIKYHWNEVAKANADIFNDDYWHFGLIAQEMQQDLPQMVSDVFKDYLVINYERLIPICWKGLQEVDDEVTKLKKKVRKLEMEIRELKQKEDKL